jgi:DNA-binding transcriptional ArsR family regulator
MLRREPGVFEAIVHPVRRDLLDALRASCRPLSVTALGDLCQVSRSTASRHLGILLENGFVEVTRQDTSALHTLVPTAFVAIDDWLWPFFDR